MSGKRIKQRMLSRHENGNAKELTKPLDMQKQNKSFLTVKDQKELCIFAGIVGFRGLYE